MLRWRAPVPNMSGVWQRSSVGMKLRNSPFKDSEVTLLYREKVANGELPDVYAGTPYDLALLPF